MTEKNKKKPGPEPERLKIENATMEDVAKKMLTTATGGAEWSELLGEQDEEAKKLGGVPTSPKKRK